MRFEREKIDGDERLVRHDFAASPGNCHVLSCATNADVRLIRLSVGVSGIGGNVAPRTAVDKGIGEPGCPAGAPSCATVGVAVLASLGTENDLEAGPWASVSTTRSITTALTTIITWTRIITTPFLQVGIIDVGLRLITPGISMFTAAAEWRRWRAQPEWRHSANAEASIATRRRRTVPPPSFVHLT